MKGRIRIILAIIVCMGLQVAHVPISYAADTAEDFCIKIVHTNDIHARVEENAKSGIPGMVKLKTWMDTVTAGADMDLVLDSGDLFHGQPIATLEKGESVADLVKACGYDAMTAGNHDWNYGKDQLKELVKRSNIQMLTGNVLDSKGNPFFDTKYCIKNIEKNGKELKVGVFGGIDSSIYSKTAKGNVEGLTFTDLTRYAKEAAADLKKQGCDIVIALTHTYDPLALAKKVDGVDLWLAGHEHISLDTEVTTPDGSKAYVVENGYHLNQVGMIDLDCSIDSNGTVSSIQVKADKVDYETVGNVEENEEVKSVLSKIKEQQSIILNQVVGSSPADLDGVWENLRVDETNLGRLVTDAYLLETGADVAFENAGGIRASIKKGDVTYKDVISVSPFGNYIVTKQITGKQLKDIVEKSIEIQVKCIEANASGEYDAWPDNSGSYLQTGGISVQYNPNLASGKRVISIRVGDKPLEENRKYTVATNNFVAESSYYSALAEAEELGEYSACDEALIKFFSQNADVISQSVMLPRMVQTTATPSPTPTATPILGVPPMPDKVVKPGKVKITSIKRKKKGSITVRYSKVKKAKKYEISYATSKKFQKEKKKVAKKQSYTIHKLKVGKTYYIRVRAVNGNTKGKWSKTCKIKTIVSKS